MITETLMRPGSGTVQLIGDTPTGISAQILDLVLGVGCHVVVTPVRLDNPSSLTDAQVLGAAIYTGRVIARPSRLQLDLLGISSWLDTHFDTTIARTSGTPTQWLGDLLTNGLSAGTVSGGSNVTRAFPAYAQTRREALDSVASLGGWEYEVRPNFTVNAGTTANVFQVPATVVITDRAEGVDGQYIGLLGGLLDQNIDTGGVATKVVSVGRTAGSLGSATQSVALRTRSGGTPSLIEVINAPSEPDANLTALASTVIAAAGPRTAATVSTGAGRMTRDTSATVRRGGAQSFALSTRDGSSASANRVGTSPGAGVYSTRSQPTSGPSAADVAAARSELAGILADNAAAARATLNLSGASAAGATSSTSQFVRRNLRPGDQVYVHDIAAGLWDDANEIIYRGETINPALYRVLSMTWPLERGLGVYLRSNAASPVYIDLTPFIEWEEPGVFIDVGSRAPGSYATGSRSNPSLEARLSGAAFPTYTPTLSGMAVGVGGTNTAEWSYDGGNLVVSGRIVFGTATGRTFPGASITASLPPGFTASSPSFGTMPVGECTMGDTGTANVDARVWLSTSTAVRFVVVDSSTAYSTVVATSTTVPFTWVEGDTITWHATIRGVFS